MTTHALLMLAAEAQATSKAAFYVLGCALVAWAIVLAFIGLSRPEFPATPQTARGVYGISVLLVVGAGAAAILTS